MFDELSASAGAEDPEDRHSKLGASVRATGHPENTRPLQADNSAAAGKSTRAGTNAETLNFDSDVTPASLTRWQNRDKSLVKDIPEETKVRDLNISISIPDSY